MRARGGGTVARWAGAVAVAVALALACSRPGGPSADAEERGAGGNAGDDGAPPAAPVVTPPGGSGSPPAPAPDRAAITEENALPGTSAWILSRIARDEIEGYALASSVRPGDTVGVAVSVSAPIRFSWALYRLGWYRGAGGREIARSGPLDGVVQPRCPPAPGSGLVACAWPATFTIATDPAWPSGVYVVKLTREDGWHRWVPLVLRAARGSEVRMVLPTATWQAYNAWGGTSLYDDRVGATAPRSHAIAVSYDRPYDRDGGAGHLLRSDLSVVTWLEAQGIDVEYLTDEDVERDPAAFAGAKAVVVSGHDEYWTRAYRDRAEEAIAAGTSLLNLGANNAYWQVRTAPAADGRDRRIVVAYKEYALANRATGWEGDPVGPTSPELTTLFRNAPVSRPENALLGVMFNGMHNTYGFPAVVTNPAHWALAGTGLRAGDVLPWVHGYETDELVANGVTPPGVEVIAQSQGLSETGGVFGAHTVVRAQGAAWVFSGGGIGFASALADPIRADPRAQRVVANVLFRMLGRPAPATLVTFSPGLARVAPDGFAARVTTVARGLGQPVGLAVHPGGGLVFSDAKAGALRRLDAAGAVTTLATGLMAPGGVAVDAAGNVYVADTKAACVRRVDPAGAVTVFAGAPGLGGTADGDARSARFLRPAGLAVVGAALVVADASAGSLRSIDLADPAHPVTTIPASGLSFPTAVAAAPDGTLVVVDTGNHRIARIVNGAAVTIAGSKEGFRDGAGRDAYVLPQYGLALLSDGALVVADPGNYRVRIVNGDVVRTLAGSGRAGTADGPGATAELVLPTGLAAGADGTIYVADTGNGAIRAIQR